MKINRKELVDILSRLRPGLGKREFISQVSHFLFFPKEIVTYNDKICISHPFDNTEGFFSVKGEQFYRILTGIAEDDVDLTLKSGQIVVRSKSTTFKMLLIAENDNKLPIMVELLKKTQKNWKKTPKGFTEGISLCAFSASPDLLRGIGACVGIVGNGCYATDGYRMSIYIMDDEIHDDLFIVAAHALELSKFPIIDYSIGDNWGHFRTKENVIFSCLLMKGTMPIDRMMNLLEETDKIDFFEIPKEFKPVVDNIIVLAADLEVGLGKELLLQFENGHIYIKAENNIGSIEKNFLCDYKGPTTELRINSHFLSQVLTKSTKLSTKETSMYFTSGDFYHMFKILKPSEPVQESTEDDVDDIPF